MNAIPRKAKRWVDKNIDGGNKENDDCKQTTTMLMALKIKKIPKQRLKTFYSQIVNTSIILILEHIQNKSKDIILLIVLLYSKLMKTMS